MPGYRELRRGMLLLVVLAVLVVPGIAREQAGVRGARTAPAAEAYAPVSASAEVGGDPHGGSDSETDLCRACHKVHYGLGERLLVAPTEKEACYQCHDGSAAATDIRSDFGEQTLGSSTRASVHPVPEAKNGVTVRCSSCHAPHRPRAEVQKLLRYWNGSEWIYSTPDAPVGNAMCYSCHGATSTYPEPLGDHTVFETSAHNTDGVPDPPSGTGMKCLACHAPHGAGTRRLGARWDQASSPAPDPSVEKDGTALCYTCHTGAENSSGGPDASNAPTDPYAAFTAGTNDYTTSDGDPVAIFHHPVDPAEQDAGARVVQCVSCHNPHLVDTLDSVMTSKLTDPTDMTRKWPVRWKVDASNWDMNRTEPWDDIVSYCTSCHVSPDTTEPITAGPRVASGVKLANDADHDSFSAAAYTTERLDVHGSRSAQLACTACHDFHGSSNAFVLKERVVSTADGTVARTQVKDFQNTAAEFTSDSEKLWSFCRNCHYRAAEPDTYPHNKGQYCVTCHYHNGGRL